MSNQRLTNLLQAIRLWLKRNPGRQAPYVGVRVPVRKGPGNRSAAAALKEPGE